MDDVRVEDDQKGSQTGVVGGRTRSWYGSREGGNLNEKGDGPRGPDRWMEGH